MAGRILASVMDGGPAFPSEFDGDHVGMSLRDYFAAHAPKQKWDHFKPVMLTPKPEPDWGGIPEDQRWDESPNNFEEMANWRAEERRQYEIQWPYFYADAMIAERERAR